MALSVLWVDVLCSCLCAVQDAGQRHREVSESWHTPEDGCRPGGAGIDCLSSASWLVTSLQEVVAGLSVCGAARKSWLV